MSFVVKSIFLLHAFLEPLIRLNHLVLSPSSRSLNSLVHMKGSFPPINVQLLETKTEIPRIFEG